MIILLPIENIFFPIKDECNKCPKVTLRNSRGYCLGTCLRESKFMITNEIMKEEVCMDEERNKIFDPRVPFIGKITWTRWQN